MRILMSLAVTLLVAAAGCRQHVPPDGHRGLQTTPPRRPHVPPASRPAKATTAPGAQVVAGPLLQVNGRYFTVDDILTAAGLELGKIPPHLAEEAFRRRVEGVLTDAVRRQVSQALVLPQADKILTEDQKKLIDQEVARALDDMVVRAGGSKKKLELDLQGQGSTLQAVLDDYRSDLTVRLLLRLKFVPVVSISRTMLWDYYCRNRDQFATPEKVQMQIISVPLSAFLAEGASQPTAAERAAAAAKARERIEQARAAVAAGEDFAAVAGRYSSDAKAGSGGLWPPMAAGSFRHEEVEKVAFSQKKGQVSDVIETQEGFFIVKTADVLEASGVSFEEAQERIERTLRDQQSAKLYNEYYQELLKGATIVQSEDFIPTAAERAVARYRGK